MNTHVFDKIWFARHQKTLLWLLNSRITKRWFRWALIKGYDCKGEEKILEIQPNNFKIDGGLKYFTQSSLLRTFIENPGNNHQSRKVAKSVYRKIQKNKKDPNYQEDKFILPAIQATFINNDKFAKRLYYNFYPLWALFHIWDLFADHYAPDFSFGFSTLTQYPDNTNTVSGTLRRAGVDESFSTIRAGAGNNAADNPDSGYFGRIAASGTLNQFERISRSGCCFDTSSIGSTGTISDATFTVFGNGVGGANDLLLGTYNIYSFTPANYNAFANADYGQFGSTVFCDTAIAFASWQNSSNNDFSLNAAGISGINKTGNTGIGGRENHDGGNSAPTWVISADNGVFCYFSTHTGTSSDPKIVINYTVASGPANAKTWNGIALASIKTRDGLAIASNKVWDGIS